MTPDRILSYEPRVLTQAQREHYFEHGYVSVESLVPADVVSELLRVTGEFVDASRTETASGNVFDLGPGHSIESPVLRRLKRPDDRHDVYWQFARGLMADVAADIAGPNVVFHHSKLNFKWFDEADSVKWHQDIQFFPHTNYNVFTIGCYLADTDMENGPLAVLPGSHDEVLYCYSSADAKPYTPHPDPSSHTYNVVRGEPVHWAEHDPRPCQIPPDWSGGYTSIFAAQAGED